MILLSLRLILKCSLSSLKMTTGVGDQTLVYPLQIQIQCFGYIFPPSKSFFSLRHHGIAFLKLIIKLLQVEQSKYGSFNSSCIEAAHNRLVKKKLQIGLI